MMKKKKEEAHEANVQCTEKRDPERDLRTMQLDQGAEHEFECINCGYTMVAIATGVCQEETEEPECKEVPYLCRGCGHPFTASGDPIRIS